MLVFTYNFVDNNTCRNEEEEEHSAYLKLGAILNIEIHLERNNQFNNKEILDNEKPPKKASDQKKEKNNDEKERFVTEEKEKVFIGQVKTGLKAQKKPELSSEGVGGAYFVKNESNMSIGVFKPIDEEPGMKNHPKEALKTPIKGVVAGEGAIKEVAAYLIDRNNEGRARVPLTCMVELEDDGFNFVDRESREDFRKEGSLQQFVENCGESWDMSFSKYEVEDVHNIGQLDVRLYNLDRNGGNMLLQKKEEGDKYGLVPIDHSYSLPALNEIGGVSFDWLYWKQAKVPFSEEFKEFVRRIDMEKDAQTLRDMGVREECIDTMKVSTLLLKIGCRKGLNLFQIASVMTRKMGKKSVLEEYVDLAKAHPGAFYDNIVQIFEEEL